MIEVDRMKCTGCGFCSDECPAGIFSLSITPRGSRTAQVSHVDQCTLCGHCVAICPEGAVSHGDMPADEFAEQQRVVIAPETMMAFLLSRRSTKAFRGKAVPGEVIEQLIEVGTHAGTASNSQTENFIIIQDRGVLAELEGMVAGILWRKMKPLGSAVGRRIGAIRHGAETIRRSVAYYERFKARKESGDTAGLIFRNAPAVIVVHGLRANFNARANCAIATRNMEILAKSLGLGTCWAGFLLVAAGLTKKVARCLDISDDRNIYGAIMLGYPKHEYRKIIRRKEREVRWL